MPKEKSQLMINPLIVISGFGWSGSGAVVDFLLDNYSTDIAGSDEIIFFWIFLRLVKQAKNRNKISVSSEDAMLFCAKIPSSFARDKREQYEKTFTTYFQHTKNGREKYTLLAQQILDELVKMSRRTRNQNFDEKRISWLAEKLLILFQELFQGNNKLLYIYDNLFHPHDISIFHHSDFSTFDRVVLFCIDRDPRDQFYEQYERYSSGLGQWHTLKLRQKVMTEFAQTRFFRMVLKLTIVKFFAACIFVRMYRKKRILFNQAIAQLQEKNLTIHYLLFEDFVCNRDNTRDKVALEFEKYADKKELNPLEENKNRFIPEQSKQNIGKYTRDRAACVYAYIKKKTSQMNL
ncbi:MAG: hypothetical protein WDA21_05435 [Bacilli bacterium]